jgi:hypothetical protein
MSYTATHRADSERGGFGRNARRGGIILSVIAILLIATAVAVYVGKANIKGGASSGQFQPVWSSVAADSKVDSSSDMTCTITPGTGPDVGSLNVNVTSAFPGGWCTLESKVTLPAGNASDGKITGVDLTLPQQWTADLRPADCVAIVSRGQLKTVQFTIAMGQNAALGESTTFSGNGLQVAPIASNVPINCSQT